jgi:hypothetical protein
MRDVKNQAAGVGRRDFLRAGAAGMLGLGLADCLKHAVKGDSPLFADHRSATVPENSGQSPKAKSVILLWMNGGPPHLDTFDPKPLAGEAYTGPLRKPLATNVPGIQIAETLPLLAKQADKYAILRSMTHGNNGHETAAYMMLTGAPLSVSLVYPTLGAVVALKKPYDGVLPPYITLTNPLGRISEAGFLGNSYNSYATGGDPNGKEFRVQGLVPARGMSDRQLQGRRDLVKSLDSLAADLDKEAAFHSLDGLQEKAYGLIFGEAKKAFDLAQEKDALREKYGRNQFGQCCLLARRLVEYGVPFVTINMGGWDTHNKNFEALKRLCPVLDAGFASLLEDLAGHGLLESTIVVWTGEFGRTPKVDNDPPWFGGRGHHGACFSAVVAGGGFHGGKVVGASDARGEQVRERPIFPWDLSASMYKLLGIDPLGRLPHPQGCVAYVTPLAGGDVQSGGLLTEIM